MGEADLMSAALLLDVASYYIGLVRPVYRDPEWAFARLPFEGRPGRIAASMIRFYRRRLVALAKIALPPGVSVRRIPAGANSTMASFPIFACANKLARACDDGAGQNGEISRCRRARLSPRLQPALSSRPKRSGVEGPRRI